MEQKWRKNEMGIWMIISSDNAIDTNLFHIQFNILHIVNPLNYFPNANWFGEKYNQFFSRF